MRSDLAALGAVFLWASLATLAIALEALPPLLMTGIGLLIGSLISVFLAKGSFSKLIPKPKILLLGGIWAVWLPRRLIRRAAECSCGAGQPGELSLAAADSGFGAAIFSTSSS